MSTATPTMTPTLIVIPATPQTVQARNPHRQLRVAAYCRVSTSDEEQLTSYEAQKTYYTEKIMTNPEWTMAGLYADEGITGTMARKRPEFLKMIRKCRRRQIDVILTKSISRFARNTVDCLNYIRELKALDIAIIFEKENINTMEMDSEIIVTMMGAFAQSESESISQNVTWGMRQAMKEGRVNFKYKQTYAYERGEDDTPKIIPKEAEVVRKIYDAYLAGASCDAIRDMLAAEGILTPKGKSHWEQQVIRGILKNEKYAGDVLMQKTFVKDCITKKAVKNNGQLPKYLVKNHHAPIIDRKTFEKVQAEMARRAGKSATTEATCPSGFSKYSCKFALNELLICGECGTVYSRRTWINGGQKKIVWRCKSRVDYGKKYCKHSPSLEEGRLQTAILAAINRLMTNRDAVIAAVTDGLRIEFTAQAGGKADPMLLEKRIAELQRATLDLMNVAMSSTDPDSFDGRFRELTEELESLREQLGALRQEQDGADPVEERIADIREALMNAPFEVTEWSESIIRQLIDTIKVMDKDKLLVIFKGGMEIEQVM